jgi:hypothetical protein
VVKSKEQWKFVTKANRRPLTAEQTKSLRRAVDKTLKVGIELEYNLPKQKSTCMGDNPDCPCISIHKSKAGIECFRTCGNHGGCKIEKTKGCPEKQEFCAMFESPCSTCDKFSMGCSKCNKKFDPKKTPECIRKNIIRELKPTGFVGSLGEHGVLDVVKDNSLEGDGGVEIVTVGRRPSFNNIHNMVKKIIDTSSPYGVFVNERASIHFHFLTGYLSSQKYNERRPHYGIERSRQSKMPSDEGGNTVIRDLETPIPEIVLSNFHQLYRRFENAIIWITSSGADYNTLTRWIKFRKSMLQHSALRNSMPSIMRTMAGEGGTESRYGAVNYSPVRFNANGDISRLHFEVRVCDGSLSPSSVAAFVCLFYGLLMKAIDISHHGLLQSGNSEYMKEARQISSRLCNNDGGYQGPRTSDTKEINPHVPVLINQAIEMLRFIKSVIGKEHPAYEVLRSLAERPLSTRRAAGESWKEIEKSLYQYDQKNTEIEEAIVKSIDLNGLIECVSLTEWIEEFANDIEQEIAKVKEGVKSLMHDGVIVWDDSLGSIIRK